MLCNSNSAAGACSPCAAGLFGATPLMTSSGCSGICAAGHACPEASTSAMEQRCAPGSYSLAGAGSCTACPAGTYGAVSGLTTAGCSGLCTAGFACPLGVACPQFLMCPSGSYSLAGAGACSVCPAGRFGSSPAMAAAECSGPCAAGFRCPANSTAPTAFACPAGQFSLAGAASCTRCRAGAYGATVGLTTEVCSGLCPAGRWGSGGLGVVTTPNCSGPCTAGYACPEGSVNSTAERCGVGRFSAAGAGSCSPCPVGRSVTERRSQPRTVSSLHDSAVAVVVSLVCVGGGGVEGGRGHQRVVYPRGGGGGSAFFCTGAGVRVLLGGAVVARFVRSSPPRAANVQSVCCPPSPARSRPARALVIARSGTAARPRLPTAPAAAAARRGTLAPKAPSCPPLSPAGWVSTACLARVRAPHAPRGDSAAAPPPPQPRAPAHVTPGTPAPPAPLGLCRQRACAPRAGMLRRGPPAAPTALRATCVPQARQVPRPRALPAQRAGGAAAAPCRVATVRRDLWAPPPR
jgi:hypothetical protein